MNEWTPTRFGMVLNVLAQLERGRPAGCFAFSGFVYESGEMQIVDASGVRHRASLDEPLARLHSALSRLSLPVDSWAAPAVRRAHSAWATVLEMLARDEHGLDSAGEPLELCSVTRSGASVTIGVQTAELAAWYPIELPGVPSDLVGVVARSFASRNSGLPFCRRSPDEVAVA